MNIFEIVNEIIIGAIEYGGDSGGPYLSDSTKLETAMHKLADGNKHYKVENVQIQEFLGEVPQFVKEVE